MNLSITTLRTRLARLLEPRAPRPDLRMNAVRELRRAGIAAGVFAMPVLPGITDRPEDLDALARAARDAGAQWFAGERAVPDAVGAKTISSVSGREISEACAALPRMVFAMQIYAPEKYRREMSARVAALRKKYDLGSRRWIRGARKMASQQLSLGLEVAVRPINPRR